MDIKKSLGERIRELRLKRSLTQEALAEKMNVSAKSLSQIERGNNFVSAEMLMSICKILQVTPKALFDFNDDNIEDAELIKEITARLKNNPYLLNIVYKIVKALDS